MNNNKKGFTLIEILAVVVLIGVLSLIAVPAVTKYLGSSRDKSYVIAESSIVNSSTNLFVDCTTDASSFKCRNFSAPDRGDYVNVPLHEIIDAGYIDPIADPAKQGEYCDADKSFVVVQNKAGINDMNSKFVYKACLYCSEYQTTDCDFERSDYSIDNPADFTINQCTNFDTFTAQNNITIPSKVYLNGQDVNTIINPNPNTVDTTKIGITDLKYIYSNISDITKVRVLDITKPAKPNISMTAGGASYNGNSWTGKDVVVTFNSTDKTNCNGTDYDGSGIKDYSYSEDNTTWKNVTNSYTQNATINKMLTVKSTDNDGNVSDTSTYKLMVDKTAPQLTNVTATTTEDGKIYSNGSSTYQNIKIVPSATDKESGVSHYVYTTDNWVHETKFDKEYIFSSNMNAEVKVKVVDKVGNRSTNTISFKVLINKTVSILYDANDGTVDETGKNVTYGSTYGSLPTPKRTGYTFDGWYTSATGGSKVVSTTKVTNDSNHTLYAHWTVNNYLMDINPDYNNYSRIASFDLKIVAADDNTVLYNQTGIGDYCAATATYGSTYYITNVKYKSGYSYSSYSLSKTGNNANNIGGVTVGANGSSFTFKHNTAGTLWFSINTKVNSYTLSFNGNGGSTPGSRTLNFGAPYGDLPSSNRAGYDFLGWFTDPNGGNQVYASTTMGAGNITVYAHWRINWSQTFNYTGGVQTFTAPYTGTYKIELYGAQGGNSNGGKGGYVSADMYFTAGNTINVYVGQQPTNFNTSVNNLSFNGGGMTRAKMEARAGGGGATDIRTVSGFWGNINSLNSRILVAGGGGGGGYNYASGDVSGGAGGGETGGSGATIYDNGREVRGGTGGTQSSGGSRGNQAYGFGGNGVWCSTDDLQNGRFGVGGYGFKSDVCAFTTSGGGGYYGGGGGGIAYTYATGGGGGSSYANTSYVKNVSHTQGVQTGHGKAVFTRIS